MYAKIWLFRNKNSNPSATKQVANSLLSASVPNISRIVSLDNLIQKNALIVLFNFESTTDRE